MAIPAPDGAEAVTITDQLIQRVALFVKYYQKHGSARLGNGEAHNFYYDAFDLLERLRDGLKPAEPDLPMPQYTHAQQWRDIDR